jgi:hypothetical protein
VQYARGVFLVQGTVSQILYDALTGNGNLIAGFVLYLIATTKRLDDLQHVIMHLEFGMRASVLNVVNPDKVLKIAKKFMNELQGGPWSYMRHVRRIAISVHQDGDCKDTHVRWPNISGDIRYAQVIYPL